jgi:putative ABC transport system permease protein
MDENERWQIVGVVKDFLIGQPDQASKPVLIKGGKNTGILTIRLKADQSSFQTTQQALAIVKKYNPDFLTEFRFADKVYAEKFKDAKNTGSLINIFAILAIFVSCMGLFGSRTIWPRTRQRRSASAKSWEQPSPVLRRCWPGTLSS